MNVRFKWLPHKQHWVVVAGCVHLGYIESHAFAPGHYMNWIDNVLLPHDVIAQSAIIRAVEEKIIALNVAQRLVS